ncbi:MAG: hypothetical protein JWM09_1087 [Francisellaceae bacterium]|nr:hypothetical protein [Francisellaceae bacterium]
MQNFGNTIEKSLESSFLNQAKLERELDKIRFQYETLMQQNKSLETELKNALVRLSEANHKNEDLHLRLQHKHNQVEILQKQIYLNQEAFDQAQKSHSNLRAEENKLYLRELAQLKEELAYIRQQYNRESENNKEMNNKVDQLAFERRQAEVEIEKNKGEIQERDLKILNQEEKIQVLETKYNALFSTHEKLLIEFHKKEELTNKADMELHSLKEKMMVIEADKNESDNKLTKILHEKIFLVQEITELKGLITQLQERVT